ncbi:MAG: ABC transporter ATP-binding protein [Sulfurimonas sp.]|jgi:capsular polysaccharide transport system ATP-binding protein
MIELQNITKIYPTHSGQRTVLDNINLTINLGDKIGILGRNGAGKSTLIRLMSGVEQPTSGYINRQMKISWPIAFAGGFQGSLTGIDNLKFICRVYGVDYREKIAYVQEFSELGQYLYEPVKRYSAGMRARLAFALSMAIEFDCYLIDEVTAVGDSRFHEKCRIELFEKRKERSMIIVSHDATYIRAHCNHICVLKNGQLYHFDDIDQAYDFYNID